MDLKQLEYIIEIDKTRNITKAAKNLFISQSALNQQLLKLEAELGGQLFYRSRTNWRPTPAGEAYLDGARKILLIKQDTYGRINDILSDKKIELRLGLMPRRGIQMFTSIYPVFHRQFLNVKLTPLEMAVGQQLIDLKNGDIDLAFVTMDKDHLKDTNYQLLGREEMILLAPSIHPVCERIPMNGTELPKIDIRTFQYEPFAIMYHGSTIRPICDRIFAEAGFTPDVLIETSTTSSIPALVSSNLCVGIVPRYYLDMCDERIRAFTLEGHPTWDLYVCYRKNSYLSEASKACIQLSAEYWQRVLIPVQTN